jgi:cell division control protein 6
LAIELLDRASLIAERDSEGTVTSEHVRAAKAMIYSAVPDGKLRALDINRKAVLLAISRAIRKSTYIPTSAAEKNYAVVCEEYDIPCRKHTQFWIYVTDLEKHGFIKTSTHKTDMGPGSSSIHISLQDIPAKVLAKKIETMLEMF